MFIISCDLAKTFDYSAISVLEKTSSLYHLRSLNRMHKGTPYTVTAGQLRGMVSEPSLQCNGYPPVLVIDGTGVGSAVEDILKAWRLPLISVKIHGGMNVIRKPGEIRVPKKDLILTLLSVFNNERLQIAQAVPEGQDFINELQRFKVKINPRTRRATFTGQGAHDDIVLSVAMGIYIGEKVL
ncbi:MAG: hypothetical protein AB2L14_29825 [Candidatus Xenobiia bacterium LiM19]